MCITGELCILMTDSRDGKQMEKQMEKKIILLDLNKTLAEHVSCNYFKGIYNVKEDVYSTNLVAKIMETGHEVHLITARPDSYQKETLSRINNETNLKIDIAKFKTESDKYTRVHDFKAKYVKSLMDRGAKPSDFIAIESNSNTHREYRKLGITEIYTRAQYLSKRDSIFKARYIQRNYNRILDFGSGNGKQSLYLRKKGLDITLFEPFASAIKADNFSYYETYASLTNTLDSIERNLPFELVVSNAVFNSIPFESDRVHVSVLLKFLSVGAKTLLVTSRGVPAMESRESVGTATKIKDIDKKHFISSGKKTKVQTFLTPDQLQEYFDMEQGFCGDKNKSYFYYRVDNPKWKGLTKKRLLEAVEFEFGIKYFDRRFDDIKKRAIKIFSERFDLFKKNRWL